ncbi:hypothetical protein ABZZ79_07660 [Streptomyces sp. NPDC006458]|uniref:hypothetical protein n=1 Tax=Streptomyces sp. NPDC006458 TaxID=3154302 RepID=UPI0033AE1944
MSDAQDASGRSAGRSAWDSPGGPASSSTAAVYSEGQGQPAPGGPGEGRGTPTGSEGGPKAPSWCLLITGLLPVVILGFAGGGPATGSCVVVGALVVLSTYGLLWWGGGGRRRPPVDSRGGFAVIPPA